MDKQLYENAFEKFIKIKNLNIADLGEKFEKFINYLVLSKYLPGNNENHLKIVDNICVGGTPDLSIDGIMIIVNGILITDINNLKNIISGYKKFGKKIESKFIFIQTKHPAEFKKAEIIKFTSGVIDFLSDVHNYPMNEKIRKYLKIKEYLICEDIIDLWEDSPTIDAYYISRGNLEKEAELEGVQKQFAINIQNLKTYNDDSKLKYLGAKELNKACVEIPEVREVSIKFNSSTINNNSDKVLLINGKDFIKYFFGFKLNDINQDIQQQDINSDLYYLIINNPRIVTCNYIIFCDSFRDLKKKVVLINPEIKSNSKDIPTLIKSYKDNIDLSAINVWITIIDERPQKNKIEIKDKSKVNIKDKSENGEGLYSQAYSNSRNFHKELEKCFEHFIINNRHIKYCYQNNTNQLKDNEFNKETLLKAFTSMFMNRPDLSKSNEEIKKYSVNKVYQRYQCLYMYFISAYTYFILSKIWAPKKFGKQIKNSYLYYLLMMYRESIYGLAPNVSSPKAYEYSTRIIDDLNNEDKVFTDFDNLFIEFIKKLKKWKTKYRKSENVILNKKPNFANHILSFSNKSYYEKNKYTIQYEGKVLYVGKDKYGKYYGFISHLYNNLIFHEKHNQDLNFEEIFGKKVIYDIIRREYKLDCAKVIELI